MKKKKQKHVAEFTVLKPNTRLMCQMYHEKSPAKILNIRMDTLAQILTYGNVHAFTNVAVVDTCSGLVVGGGPGETRRVWKSISLSSRRETSETYSGQLKFSSRILGQFVQFSIL